MRTPFVGGNADFFNKYMAKTRKKKEEVLAAVHDRLVKSKGVVLADFTGLKVIDTEELRNKCKAENVEFLAVKKTLMQKAIADMKLPGADIKYDGSMAFIFGYEDEIAPAKIVSEFAKKHVQVVFQGGILEGQLIDGAGVKALAAMPSKLELYAKVVGSLNAPISGFVNVLAGNFRGLLNVLNGIKDAKAN